MTDHDARGPPVMVVEEDRVTGLDVAAALAELGAAVLGPLPTAAEAWEALWAGARPGLAVLGLDDPAADGLARGLGARGVPVVLATARDPDLLPPDLALLPIHPKPFSAERLARDLAARLGPPSAPGP